MNIILARQTSKQSWTQAAKIVLLDSKERLEAWVVGMNETAGWNQYALEADAA